MLEGSNVMLNCPPGYLHIGPNTSTCVRNGEWVPEPREVECYGINDKINVWTANYDNDLNICHFQQTAVLHQEVISFLTTVQLRELQ